MEGSTVSIKNNTPLNIDYYRNKASRVAEEKQHFKDAQGFVDEWFLTEFKSKVDKLSVTIIENLLESMSSAGIRHGYACFTISPSYYYLGGDYGIKFVLIPASINLQILRCDENGDYREFSEDYVPFVESCISICRTIEDYEPNDYDGNALNLFNSKEKDTIYSPSFKIINEAIEYYINKIESLGLTAISASIFGDGEYEKLIHATKWSALFCKIKYKPIIMKMSF